MPPMPKAPKGKKSSKEDGNKPTVNENQLRRDLHAALKSENMENEIKLTMSEARPNRAEEFRIGGIEGGGTHSTLIVMDGKGEQLIELRGPGTNHWALGMKETATRINELIARAKTELKIPENQPLDCVGLFLSGCEDDETNKKLEDTLLLEFPFASREYVVGSDTIGSLSTGAENGGIIIIAGTGSNALLQNPDGKTFGCGGWGHMLGDEGSAYWMAHRACKYVFDDIDGLIQAPHPTTYIWPAMRNYFKVSDRKGMLIHFYANFEKNEIAGFTKELVVGCEKKDPLCKLILEENGKYLAKYLNVLARKAHNDLKLAKGGLKVICIGSVWKSWNYMSSGFAKEIEAAGVLNELTLVKLKVSSARGACYQAADKIKCDTLNKTYDNTDAFWHYST